nr:DUF4157 domain-containing protein [Actinomycetospora sp. NBRC 106375]
MHESGPRRAEQRRRDVHPARIHEPPSPLEPGHPLDEKVQRAMAELLGHDFGAVRVHADASARRATRAVGAAAFTVGHEVVLDRPVTAPGGPWLLAHELTHVAQRSGPATQVSESSEASEASEREADRAAHVVLRGEPVTVHEHLAPGTPARADESGIEEYTGPPGPPIRPRPGRLPSNAASTAARAEFDRLQPDHARRLGVPQGGQVHHGIELQVLDRYPGAFTASELNSLANMRGIQPEQEGRRQLHNSRIRDVWDRFYTQLDADIARNHLLPGTAEYVTYVRSFLTECRAQIDYYEGIHFAESRSVRLTEDDQKRADEARRALGFDPLAPPEPATYFESRLHRGLPVAVGGVTVPASAFRVGRHPATKRITHYVAESGATLTVVSREGAVVMNRALGDLPLRAPLVDPVDVCVAILTAGLGVAAARGGVISFAEGAATEALAGSAPRVRVAQFVRVEVVNGVRIAAEESAYDAGEAMVEEVHQRALRLRLPE